MQLNIKTPEKIDHWKTSDNRKFDSQEVARCHEVFLAVNPFIPKGSETRYQVICELARRFDLVPRTAVVSPSLDTVVCRPTFAAPAESQLKCAVCGEPQFDTPHGLSCKNGHGGADSV